MLPHADECQKAAESQTLVFDVQYKLLSSDTHHGVTVLLCRAMLCSLPADHLLRPYWSQAVYRVVY